MRKWFSLKQAISTIHKLFCLGIGYYVDRVVQSVSSLPIFHVEDSKTCIYHDSGSSQFTYICSLHTHTQIIFEIIWIFTYKILVDTLSYILVLLLISELIDITLIHLYKTITLVILYYNFILHPSTYVLIYLLCLTPFTNPHLYIIYHIKCV